MNTGSWYSQRMGLSNLEVLLLMSIIIWLVNICMCNIVICSSFLHKTVNVLVFQCSYWIFSCFLYKNDISTDGTLWTIFKSSQLYAVSCAFVLKFCSHNRFHFLSYLWTANFCRIFTELRRMRRGRFRCDCREEGRRRERGTLGTWSQFKIILLHEYSEGKAMQQGNIWPFAKIALLWYITAQQIETAAGWAASLDKTPDCLMSSLQQTEWKTLQLS